jgi:ABC-type glycerol-3-phosphate transport system permease component
MSTMKTMLSSLYESQIRRQVKTLDFVRRKRIKDLFRLAVLYVLASLLVLFSLIPILWMVKTSFETTEFMRSSQIQFWPIKFTLDNYRSVLTNPNAMIARSTVNSLIVSGGATLLNLAITASAAYAMSRFDFKGKLLFGLFLLLFYMIPGTLLLIGMFVLLAKMKLINNLMGLVIAYAALGIPLSVWWLKGYFDSIPVEIEEQAMIDGCTRLGALFRVIVPLALPGVVAVGLFQFVGSWNEFMIALTVIQSDYLQLLPVRIVNFMGFQRTDWGPTMAFSVIVAIPAVILFAIVQRNMVTGLMSGFTK